MSPSLSDPGCRPFLRALRSWSEDGPVWRFSAYLWLPTRRYRSIF